MKQKFDPKEYLRYVQTTFICELLRLLPEDGTPVPLNHMHVFLNRNSALIDGLLLVSVKLVDYGHHVELTCREVNYERLDMSCHDVTELDPDEENTSYFFKPETRYIIEPQDSAVDNIALLESIYSSVISSITP